MKSIYRNGLGKGGLFKAEYGLPSHKHHPGSVIVGVTPYRELDVVNPTVLDTVFKAILVENLRFPVDVYAPLHGETLAILRSMGPHQG